MKIKLAYSVKAAIMGTTYSITNRHIDMITLQEIAESSLVNEATKAWAAENIAYLAKPKQGLLTKSVKTKKGDKIAQTYVMYMQPADKVAVNTLCAMAGPSGCKAPCLISSGHLGMDAGQRKATWRTLLFLVKPDLFSQLLRAEIEGLAAFHGAMDEALYIRLNGTSDIDFSDFIGSMPHVEFYDYTKLLSRVRKNTLSNYDLTFSGSMYSPASRAALRKAVTRGHRIAVAFNTKNAKADTLEVPEGLADFDKTDLRPLDGPVIGALTRKGSSAAERRADDVDSSFFVTNSNKAQFLELINL